MKLRSNSSKRVRDLAKCIIVDFGADAELECIERAVMLLRAREIEGAELWFATAELCRRRSQLVH